MDLINEIKALRLRTGLTQKELANAVEVTPNTVARWERGELAISAPMMERLERVVHSRRSGTAVTRSSAVALDEHHRAIIDALNRRLDPGTFEECAVELLRVEWPTLVSVSGGADDGFDGAVADGTGEPFPLVTTTGEKLVPNLSRNLDQANRKDWHPTKALFATSRHITTAMRDRLFDAARARGVTLLQTYDQDWFAQRLYQTPEWCSRLLGVTGRPAALSLFPITQRPLIGDVVLGRQREVQWLLKQQRDCLVVGEPGSGKTFLLQSLALEGRALFLVDDDRTQITNDVRKLRPAAVIVDDAHADPTQIAQLDQIRRAVGAEFRIIATSWPGRADPVRSTLKVGDASELKLGRLDADTIVEIIKSIGVRGPDRLLYIIRKQAAGRPGLAATLAHLCISGNVDGVVSGESLVAELSRAFGKMIGGDALSTLAPFALGGNAGVKQDLVATSLGVAPLNLYRNLANVAAAGVVRERSDRAISVEPESLRWSIVKRVFFEGPVTLDINPILSIVENREDALQTLIGVRYRGATIPELEHWLDEANSSDLWSAYASLGSVEARYILRRHPGLIQEIAQSALSSAPETAIPMLLERVSDKDDATRNATTDRLAQVRTDSPLDQLKTWAKAISSEGEHVLERRLAIVRATISWGKERGHERPAIRALCIALLPGLDYSVPDPGIGNKISHVSRMLRDDELLALTEHWPAVLEVVKGTTHVPWTDLFDLVEAWLVPQTSFFPPVKFDKPTDKILRNFAAAMLRELSECSRQHPGVQHQIGQLASRLDISIDLKLCPVFEVLCPSESIGSRDWESQHREWSDATSELADNWKARPVDDTASLLRWFEDEADLAGIDHPRLSHLFCTHLMDRVPDPKTVADALIRDALPSALVAPFVHRAAVEDSPGWHTLAQRCLTEEEYRWTAVETVLKHPAPSRELLTEAVSKAAEMPDLQGFLMSSCRSIPEATITEMLTSNDSRVAVATAVGYSLAFRGVIPGSLGTAWRRAIFRSARDMVSGQSSGHWIEDILSKDSGLAVDWLVSNLTGSDSSYRWTTLRSAKKVVGSLGLAQRRIVLARVDAVGASYVITEVMKPLIGGDLDLYGQLLKSKSLEPHHLDPLNGDPGNEWRAMALAALESGYATQDVVDATLGRGRFWFGPESEMWKGRRLGFQALVNDPDDGIAEIGRVGVHDTSEWENAALVRERETAVEGRH